MPHRDAYARTRHASSSSMTIGYSFMTAAGQHKHTSIFCPKDMKTWIMGMQAQNGAQKTSPKRWTYYTALSFETLNAAPRCVALEDGIATFWAAYRPGGVGTGRFGPGQAPLESQNTVFGSRWELRGCHPWATWGIFRIRLTLLAWWWFEYMTTCSKQGTMDDDQAFKRWWGSSRDA